MSLRAIPKCIQLLLRQQCNVNIFKFISSLPKGYHWFINANNAIQTAFQICIQTLPPPPNRNSIFRFVYANFQFEKSKIIYFQINTGFHVQFIDFNN